MYEKRPLDAGAVFMNEELKWSHAANSPLGFGYRPKERTTIEGNRIYTADVHGKIVGYLATEKWT